MKDIISRAPGVMYLSTTFPIVNTHSIDFLVQTATKEGRNIARICLHKNEQSSLMAMLIVVLNRYIYPPHRHSWKSECYSIMKGSCMLQIYEETGTIKKSISLTAGDVVMNEQQEFHALHPLSDVLVYVETTTGPFRQDGLEYLNDLHQN